MKTLDRHIFVFALLFFFTFHGYRSIRVQGTSIYLMFSFALYLFSYTLSTFKSQKLCTCVTMVNLPAD